MTSPTFRRDIEGLRALAVLLVLIFHAGLPVPGGYVGVDVFFVISGFLITGLLLREAEASGSVSLLGFYARRAKRLLPASGVVLLVCAIGCHFWSPKADRVEFGWDIAAAAGYIANWRFAQRSVDYLAEDVGRSPVLHFWSLSVEEQFYFLWPLLVIAAAWSARRWGWPVRRVAGAFLLLVLIPSLGWSVVSSTANSSEAFFATPTRLWEMSIGALLAVAAPALAPLPQKWGSALSGLGLGGLALSAFLFDESASWPGHAALLPTSATAMLIAGGGLSPTSLSSRFLSCSPMTMIGGISYSLYLWHWPVVVLGQDWLGLGGPAWGSALIGVSVLPAWLSYRFIEQPSRTSKMLSKHPGFAVSFGVNISLACLLAGVAVQSIVAAGSGGAVGDQPVQLLVEGKEVRAKPSGLGAGALGKKPKRSPEAIPQKIYVGFYPPPRAAARDLPLAYELGCQLEFGETRLKDCPIGDPDGRVRVAVLGDSKILQYYEALDVAGQALGWNMRVHTKSACAFTSADTYRDGASYRECNQVNSKLLDELTKDPVDIVLVSHQARSAGVLGMKSKPNRSAMVEGLVQAWSRLTDVGSQVIVLLDNPRPEADGVYRCVRDHVYRQDKCAFKKARAIEKSGAGSQREAAARVKGASVVDLTDYLCPGKVCPPVIGAVLLYRQGSHITNTYARTLAPILTSKLRKAAKL